MLLFLMGISANTMQEEVQLESTTRTEKIADRKLKAIFLTAIELKYYFFILQSILFKVMA